MYIEEPVHGSTRRGENLNLWLLVECLQRLSVKPQDILLLIKNSGF
jgi:hypothetical protein